MILPIYAGLERIPRPCSRHRKTSAAARCTTFRRVVLPLAFPAVVAGSIFTFTLTLGDYIAPGPYHERADDRHVIYNVPRPATSRSRRRHAVPIVD